MKSTFVYKFECDVKIILEIGFLFKEKSSKLVMQSQHLLIEERCTSCGGNFDLSFDLDVKGNESDDMPEVIRKVERNRNSLMRHLCWDCRKIR